MGKAKSKSKKPKVKTPKKKKTPKPARKQFLVTGMTVSLNVMSLDEKGIVDAPAFTTRPFCLTTAEVMKHRKPVEDLLKQVFSDLANEGEVLMATTEKGQEK